MLVKQARQCREVLGRPVLSLKARGVTAGGEGDDSLRLGGHAERGQQVPSVRAIVVRRAQEILLAPVGHANQLEAELRKALVILSEPGPIGQAQTDVRNRGLAGGTDLAMLVEAVAEPFAGRN